MQIVQSSPDGRFVTVSVTLPAGGLFREQLAALKDARQECLKCGTVAASQALHTIIVAMEYGINHLECVTEAPTLAAPPQD